MKNLSADAYKMAEVIEELPPIREEEAEEEPRLTGDLTSDGQAMEAHGAEKERQAAGDIEYVSEDRGGGRVERGWLW